MKVMSLLIVTLLTMACQNKASIPIASAQPDSLQMEVSELPVSKSEPDARFFAVRIYPPGQNVQKLPVSIKETLEYKVDSSFYMVNARGGSGFPMVQSVQNGRKDCFEYLLVFDKKDLISSTSLVYSDACFDHKKHIYLLKN